MIEGGTAVPTDQTQYWTWARELLDTRSQRKWTNFSWITTRALISALNDRVSTVTPRLVDELRAQWMARTAIVDEQKTTDLVIDRSDCSSFIVLGDPGEQDASQYIVVPALENELRTNPDIGFMVVCSDVIYPSGDVNDYVDGFYVPYQNLRSLPIYALPGNHDWYDGLAGFMWNFCDQEPLPASVFGVSGKPPLEWLGRLFWRRPSHRNPTEGLEARRRMHRVAAAQTIGRRNGHVGPAVAAGGAEAVGPLQVSPYFAIQTKDLLLVCIDTGIDGNIDHAQGEWLLRVSKPPGAKMLLTGKPLLVDRAEHPCAIAGGPVVDTDQHDTGEIRSFGSVLDIVRYPEHSYSATLGGDIHNYQLYQDGEMPHIVAGGGGAFMSATHTINEAAESSTFADTKIQEPLALSPNPAQSLSHFAQLMLPRIWRIERLLLAVFIGAVAGAVLSQVIGIGAPRIAGVSAIAFGALTAARSLSGRLPRLDSPTLWSVVAVATAGIAGVALTSTTVWLDSEHHAADLLLVLLSLAITIAAMQAVRWSGWSLPAPTTTLNDRRKGLVGAGWRDPWWPARPQSGDDFVGRMLVVGGVLALIALLAAFAGQRCLAITVGVTLLVWLVGWFIGRRWAGWRSVGATVALLVVGGVVTVCARLVVGVHPGVIGYVGATAILLPLLAIGLSLVATCVLSAIIAVVVGGGVPTPLSVIAGDSTGVPDPRYPRKRFEMGWGRAGSLAPWLLAVGFVTALVLLSIWWPPVGAHSWPLGRLSGTVGEVETRRAGVSAAIALSVTALLIFLMDALRRYTGRAFKPWAALLGVLICVFVAPNSLWSGWLLHDIVGVVVVTTYLGLLVLIGNLVLIGGPALMLDREAHDDDKTVLDVESAGDVLAWRRLSSHPTQTGADGSPTTPDKPARKYRRRANLVAPGSDKPQGPLQKLVAEIFDSNQPPFYKNFAVIHTQRPDDGDVRIDVDMVVVTGKENVSGPQDALPGEQTIGPVRIRHRF